MFMRISKIVLAVLLVNGLFYTYYKIAWDRMELSPPVFAVGCVVLLLVVGVFSNWLHKTIGSPGRNEAEG